MSNVLRELAAIRICLRLPSVEDSYDQIESARRCELSEPCAVLTQEYRGCELALQLGKVQLCVIGAIPLPSHTARSRATCMYEQMLSGGESEGSCTV